MDGDCQGHGLVNQRGHDAAMSGGRVATHAGRREVNHHNDIRGNWRGRRRRGCGGTGPDGRLLRGREEVAPAESQTVRDGGGCGQGAGEEAIFACVWLEESGPGADGIVVGGVEEGVGPGDGAKGIM